MFDSAYMASSSASFLKPILPSAFLVLTAAASYSYERSAPNDLHEKAKVDQSSRNVRVPLTSPTHLIVEPSVEDSASNLMPDVDFLEFLDEEWISSGLRSTSWQASYDQLSDIESFDEGWQGFGSKAADFSTIADAYYILNLLEEEGSLLAPMVGLDAEGIVVLTWDSPDLVGTMSVFGDDTFAYYLERNGEVVSAGEASLFEEIAEALQNALMA